MCWATNRLYILFFLRAFNESPYFSSSFSLSAELMPRRAEDVVSLHQKPAHTFALRVRLLLDPNLYAFAGHPTPPTVSFLSYLVYWLTGGTISSRTMVLLLCAFVCKYWTVLFFTLRSDVPFPRTRLVCLVLYGLFFVSISVSRYFVPPARRVSRITLSI